jgi:hypothetical protein
VEHYLIRAQYLRTQFGDNLPVYFHYTSLDELVGLTTAAYTGISQELVQTDGLVGIDVIFLILDTLLHRIFCIGIVWLLLLLFRTKTALGATLVTAGLIAATWLITTTRLVASARLLTIFTTWLVAALTLWLITTLAILLTGTRLVIATWLITSARLVASAWLITTFTTWLVAALTLWLITTLAILLTGTWLVTAAWLITSAWLVAATGLLTILTTRLVAVFMLRSATGQTSAESLRTETALFLTVITIVAALIIGTCLLVNTRTW